MHHLTCDEVQDAAPRFALDILDARARASVAAHLLRCPACRVEVSDMQESAARLLDLGPDAAGDARPWESAAGWRAANASPVGQPPPDGPEWGEADRAGWDWAGAPAGTTGDPGAVPAGRRRLRLVLTLAAAALLMVGTTLGPEFEQSRAGTGQVLGQAALLDGGRPVGMVYFYAGSKPAIELEVAGLDTSRLTCETVAVDGTVVRLGQFRLYGGRAAWAAAESTPLTRLSSVVLLDDGGHLVAQAAVG